MSPRKLLFSATLALAALPACAAPEAQILGTPTGAAPATAPAANPPIPIALALPRAGFVTLVIEDAAGKRVRNLISETPLPAGNQTVYWDGLDDLGRDLNAATHAVYHIPGKLVAPGTYAVRGLFRQALDLRYEFAVYNPGLPPWKTSDDASQWLTNHTPPSAVCFVPANIVPDRGPGKGSPAQVLVGSFVAEGGSGLAWVDLSGRKLHGQMWVGGVWTGAPYICRDAGAHPVAGTYAYTASAWKGDKYNNNQSELRLHKLVNGAGQRLAKPKDTRMGSGEDPRVLEPTWKFPDKAEAVIGGIAAYNGTVFVSLAKMNAVLLVDAAGSKALGQATLDDPRGLTCRPDGTLLAISGKQVVQGKLPADKGLADPAGLKFEPLITAGLEAPEGITTDSSGNIYVSDHGNAQQVKVFGKDGKFVRAIGTPGPLVAGRYDPTHMHKPTGLAVDDKNQLWVAEADTQPKRLSVWSTDGKLLQAYYGPPPYGGGGALDPQDKTLFYLNGMTFKLNWEAGTSQLIAIHHRPGPDDQKLPGAHNNEGDPETAIYLKGQKYWTNCFNANPTGGTRVVTIWKERGGVAVPVAAFGNAEFWPVLAEAPLAACLPAPDPKQKVDPAKPRDLSKLLFAWTDLNGDGHAQPDELHVITGSVGPSVSVGPDLALACANGKLYRPQSFTPAGAPVYDLAIAETVMENTNNPVSSGGGQILVCPDGNIVLTNAAKPYAPQSLGGGTIGNANWSYPSPWPGLHASHIAPPPTFPGEVIGTTRLLGPAFACPGNDAMSLWAINGNKGNVYLFTTDGLMVATLFQDCREKSAAWSNWPHAERNMSLANVTNNEESFWPSITRTSDGHVYLVTNWPAILRVDGLDTIQRLAPRKITVTPEILLAAGRVAQEAEAARQRDAAEQSVLTLSIRKDAPKVDGDLTEWLAKAFVTIDSRNKQVGDWGRKKIDTQAALCVSGDRLYAAFRTDEPNALDNSGAALQNLFKTGGALDLMLQTDSKADPKRKGPAAGDIRLLVAVVNGKPLALVYRAVVPGYKGDGVLFSSPLRTIRFDEVKDISDQLVLAQGTETTPAVKDKPAVTGPSGSFEFSIPLAALGLPAELAPGLKLRGDIGILRGTRLETTQRAYWHNKATGITSDIPSEAELTPALWGTIEVREP